MRRLILIRHSVPEIEPDKPAAEWKLSPLGRKRCQTLAASMVQYSLSAIATSPEPKAFETAQLLNKGPDVPIDLFSGLREHSRHRVPFTSAEKFGVTIKEFFQFPDQLVFGEETANQARIRFSGTVNSILAKYHNNDVALVTHGTVMTLFASMHFKTDPFHFWKNLQMPSLIAFILPEFCLEEVVLDFT